MGKTKKVLKITGQVLGVAVVGYLTFYVVFNLVEPNRTAQMIGYKAYNVETGSMDPVFRAGDLIMTVKSDFNNLKEGDIVTFVDPLKNVVTHHFVRYEYRSYTDVNGKSMNEKVFRTRPETNKDGTPNLTIDAEGNKHFTVDYWKINEANFVGKVAFKIPGLGHVVSFLQSWVGILTLVMGIAFVFVLVAIIKYLKKDKKQAVSANGEVIEGTIVETEKEKEKVEKVDSNEEK